jgi:hypothetical protein
MSNESNPEYIIKKKLRFLDYGGEPYYFIKKRYIPYKIALTLEIVCLHFLLGFLIASSNAFELSIDIEKALLVLSTSFFTPFFFSDVSLNSYTSEVRDE